MGFPMSNPYQNKIIVVFGASQDPSKYGYKIFHTLTQKGFTVYGINPKGGEVNGQKLFASLADVPGPVDVAIMVIPNLAIRQGMRFGFNRISIIRMVGGTVF